MNCQDRDHKWRQNPNWHVLVCLDCGAIRGDRDQYLEFKNDPGILRHLSSKWIPWYDGLIQGKELLQ